MDDEMRIFGVTIAWMQEVGRRRMPKPRTQHQRTKSYGTDFERPQSGPKGEAQGYGGYKSTMREVLYETLPGSARRGANQGG